MAFTTVNKSTDHFNTLLYTGTGSSNALTGVGFQPDMTWIKVRSEANNHELYDAVRGVTKRIYPDLSSAEDTNTAGLTAFGTDGFTVNTGGAVNGSSKTYVAWNWKAGGGAGSSNTDGSLNTTSTSVNTTAGISISKVTTTGSAARTIGHGLGAVPKMYIVKRTDSSGAYQVYHQGIGAGKYLEFNEAQQEYSDPGRFNGTTPTSSVLSIGTEWGSGQTLIVYAFAEVPGFSKFAYWQGNGNANGAFIYTGFKPAFFISKGTTVGQNWFMYDNKRSPINTVNTYVYTDGNNAETTGSNVDFLSNGIKIRTTSAGLNSNTEFYAGMIFAENTLVGTNNIPSTAR